MIEVIAAASVASKAFNYIHSAIQKGHDIHELGTKFSLFFDSKDQIAAAEAELNNSSAFSKVFAAGSIEGQALQITMAKHKTAEMEKSLREIILYTVGKEFLNEMYRQRRVIRARRLEAIRAKARSKRLIIDSLCFSLFGGVIVAISLFLYGVLLNV
jgi:hypothetical protein